MWRRDREEARARNEAARVESERRSQVAAHARASASEDRDQERADAERRVSAMAERRQGAVARVPDSPPADNENEPEPKAEEHGPLGPGIRPSDFWGVCAP
jgi:hypothetical protein